MGLIYHDLELLLYAKRNGAKFDRIATIGRQSVYLRPRDVRRIKRITGDQEALSNYIWGDYCENVLKSVLGSSEVVSFDASAYEQASVVHDMNTPLEGYFEAFDLVIDGGSLEHIFNVPIAVGNMMRMVRTGGHILNSNPMNNLAGHGFYQFSPELMYRIFRPRNGFQVRAMLVTEHRLSSVEIFPPKRVLKAADPSVLRRRSMVVNRHPLMLRTLSHRLDDKLPGELDVQQSDYVATWSGDNKVSRHDPHVLRRLLMPAASRLPRGLLKILAHVWFNPSLRNRHTFQRWDGLDEE